MVLTKNDMEEQLLAICSNCKGSGKLSFEDSISRPLGYIYPSCPECGQREQGEPMPLMASFSFNPSELTDEQKNEFRFKCDWCEGKGWFETPDWSMM